MAKAVKRESPRKQQEGGFLLDFQLSKVVPEKYHVVLAIAAIVILFLIALSPLYFGGKTFQSGDILAEESVKPYIEKARDGFSLWNPHIFFGMPAYALGTEATWFNLIYIGITALRSLFSSFFSGDYVKWSFYLILLAVTTYFFMRQLSKNTMVSLFTALATSFSTGIIVFLFIGHVTKLTVLCMFPLLFLLLFRMQQKFRWLDFFLLAITMQLLVQGFHVQIIFYIGLTVTIYFIYFMASALVRKDSALRAALLKTAGALVLATGIAVLIQSDNLTQIYEYTPYSTRGGKSITEVTTGKAEQSESEYYNYHTSWSFSPGEVMTFMVPSWYGFGNGTYKGPLSQNQEVQINTYFGQMEFVDVAMYMGVLVFFLALFGAFTRWKEPFVRFLVIAASFFLLLSFGKNFPVVFDLMFNFFPQFNKFRVPSMALVIVQMIMPILAGLGLHKIITMRDDKDPKSANLLRNIAFVFAGLFILSLVLNSAVADWFMTRVDESARAEQLKPIREYMADVFTGDLLIALGMTAAMFGLSYLYTLRRLGGDVLVAIIIVFTLFDLWRINGRGAQWVDAPDLKKMFEQPPFITAIKEQKDTEPFRMVNIKGDGSLGTLRQNSNYNAYFLLEDFHGYSAIKPRAYQDLMDVVGPVNPTLWRMSNVRYVISDQEIPYPGFVKMYDQNKTLVYKNISALPRYFFTDSVAVLPSIQVLNRIKENVFDPAAVAYIPEGNVSVQKPDSTAIIRVMKYTDERIELDVLASGNNFLVNSATYLPTGWAAYIDGNKTELYRANHAFMGVVVPKGRHKVEFIYAPKSFTVAKYLALSLSSLVVAGLLITLALELLKKRRAGADAGTRE